jgi:glycerol-3-phosphate cytidylyltransferase-like family protein
VIEDEQPNVIALGYDQKVLIENFTERLGKNIKVVRLTSFKPEIYKSSKISDHLVSL